MNAISKNKYIFGIGIIAVFLGIMIYLLTETNIGYENDFKKVMSSAKVVHATGSWVKEKSYEHSVGSNQFIFYMKDATGTEMQVVLDGSMPNNFESATSVIATGEYKDGVFHAKKVLTKCPSKYQDQYKIQEEQTNKQKIS